MRGKLLQMMKKAHIAALLSYALEPREEGRKLVVYISRPLYAFAPPVCVCRSHASFVCVALSLNFYIN